MTLKSSRKEGSIQAQYVKEDSHSVSDDEIMSARYEHITKNMEQWATRILDGKKVSLDGLLKELKGTISTRFLQDKATLLVKLKSQITYYTEIAQFFKKAVECEREHLFSDLEWEVRNLFMSLPESCRANCWSCGLFDPNSDLRQVTAWKKGQALVVNSSTPIKFGG